MQIWHVVHIQCNSSGKIYTELKPRLMLVKERIEAWIRSGSETLYLATRGWAYIRSVRQGFAKN
jgi:hypothetical protein